MSTAMVWFRRHRVIGYIVLAYGATSPRTWSSCSGSQPERMRDAPFKRRNDTANRMLLAGIAIAQSGPVIAMKARSTKYVSTIGTIAIPLATNDHRVHRLSRVPWNTGANQSSARPRKVYPSPSTALRVPPGSTYSACERGMSRNHEQAQDRRNGPRSVGDHRCLEHERGRTDGPMAGGAAVIWNGCIYFTTAFARPFTLIRSPTKSSRLSPRPIPSAEAISPSYHSRQHSA
jgi:hypothetical protein